MAKFFTFRQNNSGGDFDVNDNVAHYVIIEANSVDEANAKAKNIGIYFDGVKNGSDCECCGDRWHAAWEDGDSEPKIWGKTLQKALKEGDIGPKSLFKYECRIHMLDGTVRCFPEVEHGN